MTYTAEQRKRSYDEYIYRGYTLITVKDPDLQREHLAFFLMHLSSKLTDVLDCINAVTEKVEKSKRRLSN
jgi:hypothetical protein